MNALGSNPKRLAKTARLGETAIRDILHGRSQNPRSDTLEKIASALGCTVGDLMRDAGMGLEATEIEVAEPDASMVLVPEYDVRAAAGDGFVIDNETVKAQWPFSRPYLRNVLGVSSSQLAVVEVVGDSMSPTLESGDRVLVDLLDRRPSPPGLFVLWDGDGTLVKRVERVLNSQPAMVAITSDNPRHRSYEQPAELVSLVGRVIWFARRL